MALENKDRSELLVVINVNGQGDSGSQSAAVANIVNEIKRRMRDPEAGLESISIADLHLDRNLHEVTRGGKHIHLSRLEFSLLEYLALHRDRVQTDSSLMEAVFGGADKGRSCNTLWVHMHRLRKKVDQRGAARLLQTIRGVGYVLRTPSARES